VPERTSLFKQQDKDMHKYLLQTNIYAIISSPSRKNT